MAKRKPKLSHKFFSDKSQDLCAEICIVAVGRGTSTTNNLRKHIDWAEYARLKGELIREHMKAMDEETLARAHNTINHINQRYGSQSV